MHLLKGEISTTLRGLIGDYQHDFLRSRENWFNIVLVVDAVTQEFSLTVIAGELERTRRSDGWNRFEYLPKHALYVDTKVSYDTLYEAVKVVTLRYSLAATLYNTFIGELTTTLDNARNV